MVKPDESAPSSRPVMVVGLPMPNDFPADLYDSINARAQQWWQHAPHDTPAGAPLKEGWAGHFAGGWQGVAYRFLDCVGYDESFTDSMQREGPTPADPMERYVQHRALFGFFVTGQAALENLFYSLYALGAALKANEFTLIAENRLTRIKLAEVAMRYEAVFPDEPLSMSLHALDNGAADGMTPWGEWTHVRNILPHRMSPGLSTTLRVGGTDVRQTTSWWAQDLVLDDQTTARRRAWLAKTLTDILSATELFTQHRFV